MIFNKGNRWAGSKESTGEDLGEIGYKFGRMIVCWEAVGTARSAFQTLQGEILEYIEQTCEPLPAVVTWSLYMVGRSREASVPAVTFISSEPGPRKRLRELILKSKLLDQYPGFVTMDIDRPPGCNTSTITTLGGPNVEGLPGQYDIFITFPVDGLMGASIRVVGEETIVATGGALFQSNGTLFMSTVGHPFDASGINIFPPATLQEEYHFDIDEISEWEEEDSSNVDCTSAGSVTSNSPSNTSDSGESSDARSKSDPPLPRHATTVHSTSQSAKAPSNFGNKKSHNATADKINTSDGGNDLPHPIAPDSYQDIGVGNSQSRETFYVRGPAILLSKGASSSLDYSIWELPNPIVEKLLAKLAPKEINPSAPQEPRSVQVVIHTAFGVVPGKLLATATFRQPAGIILSQQLWTVIIEGSLRRGICGSLVVDPVTGDIFGHIVAGAPEDGFAYMTPFHQILADLNQRSPNIWKLASVSAETRIGEVYKDLEKDPSRLDSKDDPSHQIASIIFALKLKNVHGTRASAGKRSRGSRSSRSYDSGIGSSTGSDRTSHGALSEQDIFFDHHDFMKTNRLHPQALNEALEAAYDNIQRLEAANSKLDAQLTDSIKENRTLKREKADLVYQVESLMDDLDDEKRKNERIKRESRMSRISSIRQEVIDSEIEQSKLADFSYEHIVDGTKVSTRMTGFERPEGNNSSTVHHSPDSPISTFDRVSYAPNVPNVPDVPDVPDEAKVPKL